MRQPIFMENKKAPGHKSLRVFFIIYSNSVYESQQERMQTAKLPILKQNKQAISIIESKKSPAQHLKCTQDLETCYEIFGLQVFSVLLNRTLNLVHALPYIGNSNERNTDTVGKYARDNHADTANEE